MNINIHQKRFFFLNHSITMSFNDHGDYISAYFPVRCNHEFCGKLFRTSDAVALRKAWITGGDDMSYARLWHENPSLSNRFKRHCCRSTLENYGCPDVWQETYDFIDSWEPPNLTFNEFIKIRHINDHRADQEIVMIKANMPTTD